jgi:hypothetical protein
VAISSGFCTRRGLTSKSAGSVPWKKRFSPVERRMPEVSFEKAKDKPSLAWMTSLPERMTALISKFVGSSGFKPALLMALLIGSC